MKRGLLQSLGSAIPISLFLAACLVASETLHLTRRNAFFVTDLGGTFVWVVGGYVLFAFVVGGLVGAAIRSRREQAFALAAVGYLVVSLKIYWLDAELLTSPRIAAAFVLFTCGWFLAAASAAKRLSLPDLFPVLLTVIYANVCLGIASRWGLGGGRLLPFLLSVPTIVITAVGALGAVGLTALQRSLERRPSRRWRVAVPIGIVVALSVVTVTSARRLPQIDEQPRAEAEPTGPDIYIVSFDALRTDMLKTFIASHPNSHLARISQLGTTFENVVAQGPSTDATLANNTFAGTSWTDCRGSIPRQLVARGYFTAMLFANLGKRFEGSDCYEYYFSGDGDELARRYAVPALTGALANRTRGLDRDALRARELVEKLRRVARTPAPVYAYLHFLELHAPYAPERSLGDSAFEATVSEFMRRCYLVACDPRDSADARLIDFARRSYVELIDEADRALGHVMEIARERGRDYVVVVTADHGELFGEHGGFAHGGGFVGELLDIPFLVFDSRSQLQNKRCELLLSGEAMRATAMGAGESAAGVYPDRQLLELSTPPLGHARIDKQNAVIDYELSAGVIPHAGTWRNIHRTPKGTIAYPIERCE
jgi:hypothetical protein